MTTQSQHKVQWIPLSTSLGFMIKNKRVFGWSFLLIAVTIVITWTAFNLSTHYLDSLSIHFLESKSTPTNIWETITNWFTSIVFWFYLIGTRIACFYFSFLLAYCLTCPGYFFLSHAAEKIYTGKYFDPDAAFTLQGILLDLREGVKIALLGVLITIMTFALNFIPLIGQGLLLFIYVFYSALIFIDYPASRRRWSLKSKISWLRTNSFSAIRIGLLPAVISLIPVINIFGLAIIFPLMTVHSTLNFSAIEVFGKNNPSDITPPPQRK